VAPVLYVQNKFREAFNAIADQLPAYTLKEPEANQNSFSLEFVCWQDRDKARDILHTAQIRFRAGKCLLPFRITGNISWGVPAPDLDGSAAKSGQDLTVWCWPESLWAPISFVQTTLALDEQASAEGGSPHYSCHDWRMWWCAKDAQVFQFIGQDNIYFYCVAQPAIWDALEANLFQDTPVANYHILFMNKKASSSGKIKPPMANELLEHYSAEQLRCHWLSLALDQKAVSFAPKVYDKSISHKDKKTGQEVRVCDDPRIADPALKESAFLTNIFNRLARSCFYGAANVCGNHLPHAVAHLEEHKKAREATLAFERAAHDLNAHEALSIVESYAREANKRWDSASKAAKGNDAAYEQALADAFCALRTTTLLMHPATPAGCETICKYLGFKPEFFFSWDQAFDDPAGLAIKLHETPETHEIAALPPRFDFFEKTTAQKR
jgi:methionyl-tRNA synthetase